MRYPAGYYEQQYNFDFFNYAGIHRPVILYTTVNFDLIPNKTTNQMPYPN